MKINDLIIMAFKNLWRRKLRTSLTVLGVVIGCTSIIIMISFGLAQQKQLEELTGGTSALQSINVHSKSRLDPNAPRSKYKEGVITDRTIEEIKKLENVESVIYFTSLDPENRGYSFQIDDYSYVGPIGGMNKEVIEVADLEISEGRMIESSNPRQIEVLVSSRVKYLLQPKDGDFENYNPEEIENINLLEERAVLALGNQISAFPGPISEEPEDSSGNKKYKINIVGIYEGDLFGAMPGIIIAEEVVDELNDELRQMSEESPTNTTKSYDRIQVKVTDPEYIEETTEMISDMGFEASHDTGFVESLNQVSMVMQAILGGIGGISLLVAAIGITNSMIMSVYERTKEIGVMKVIGAKVSDIRNLFLLEAGMMGLLGGLVGVFLSLLISRGLNTAFATLAGSEKAISIISPQLALGAMLICFLIGLITGYYPAVKATKLSALEAIKTE